MIDFTKKFRKQNLEKKQSFNLKLLYAFLVSMTLGLNGVIGQTSYTSTAVSTAWNASRWNNSSDASPYSSAYTANNAVNFTSGTYTFAGMGANTNVGNVTVGNNVTVRFASANNLFLTNSSVRTFNIGTGGLFDFNAQGVQPSTTTGFIKNGAGILAFAGGGYAGGFTLNAGTVIAGSSDAFGSGVTNVLTLNGGTVASTTSRTFTTSMLGGGIVIGGNIQFGEVVSNASLADSSAELTFDSGVNLGNALRTFTLGNAGNVTFTGVISNSGSNGITFTSNNKGTGRFDLLSSGNTFTGPVSIIGNGSNVTEVRIRSSLVLGNSSNSVIINGGRLSTNAISSITIFSGRSIQLGNVAGNSITSNTTGNGLIINSVISDLAGSTPGSWSKDGTGVVNLAEASTYTGSTTINNGTLRLSVGSNRLPTTTVLRLGQASSSNLGTFDLAGFSQSIAGLNSNSGTNATASNNTITSSTAATLTVSGAGSYGDGSNTNSGIISGAVSLVKSGTGTLTLADANTYTGTTTISGGTLRLNRTGGNTLATSNSIIITGGILQVSTDQTIVNLTLTSGTVIIEPGVTLTITGTITRTLGVIQGSSTSNLVISGASGTIAFDQSSLGTTNVLRNLTISGNGTTTLANTLNIIGGAASGVVTVGSGATLNTGNNLILKSNAAGTASIGNSSGAITNNVTIERFIPRRRAFRFLASPVNTTNFISGSWQQTTHITGSLTGLNGFDQSNSGTASMFTYNASSEAWTPIPNTTSTNLNIGTGYRMLIRGDRNIDINNIIKPDSNALVLSATGTIITGNVVFGAGSVSSSPAGIPALNAAIGSGANNSTVGWSLIGNPYACAVNWASVTKSNVSTTFATWNVNNAGRGNYVYHSGSVGTGNGASNIINSGQSIFVQTTAANPSITFTEASKVTSAPPSHFKKSLSDVLNIDIFIGDRAYDALTVMFDANTSNNYDVQDFIKLVNPEINFYSYLVDGTKLAMNSMKELTSETIVPLGLNGVFNGGSYELKFSNQNTFNNSEVYLKDKFINKTYDLKSINNLTFNVTADSNSFGENRFELIFSKSATGLNNELSSSNNFIVFPNPANNVLNLSLTTTKEDNYNFTIYNQLGAEVNAGSLDFNAKRTHALNIENLSSGVYFIQVKNGKTSQTIKFIK
jgi:autotransporter-associated beta strand protein